MSLTRKFLSAMGIESDKIDEIINAHAETVDGLKDQLRQFRSDSEKLPEVERELEELKAAGNNGNAFEVKYNALKEEFTNYKKDVEKRESNSKKEAAYRALLKDAGVSDKRIDAVVRVTNLDMMKLAEDGTLEDSPNLKKNIQTEWADFIVSSDQQGAHTASPPAGGGGKAYKTKDEIMAIKDNTERQKAIAENHELFGF